MKEKNEISSTLHRAIKSTPGAVFLVTLVLTLIVHIITGGNFYTVYNTSTYLRAASFIIIIGIAQTLVLLLGGIDLSVASIAGFSSMVFALAVTKSHLNPYFSIILALAVGFLLGAINGIIICKLKLTPFIVTLATSSVYTGIIYVKTRGVPLTGIPKCVTIIGQGTLFHLIPFPALIAAAVAIIFGIILRFTQFGRHIYAVGGNERAARIVGIRSDWTKMGVYSLAGFVSGLTGILMVLRLGSSQVNIGQNWVMPSITAAVLGGTSMSGGIGTAIGTVVGGLLMSAISYCINLLGISSYWDDVVTGLVVLVAVAIDAIRQNYQS
jgi:ribose transport system permease protein